MNLFLVLSNAIICSEHKFSMRWHAETFGFVNTVLKHRVYRVRFLIVRTMILRFTENKVLVQVTAQDTRNVVLDPCHEVNLTFLSGQMGKNFFLLSQK